MRRHEKKFSDGNLVYYHVAKKSRHSKRLSAAGVSIAVFFLWLLWASLPIIAFGFLPIPRGYPYANLRRTWIRVQTSWQLKSAERAAASQPRYQRPSKAHLPEIFVVSLSSETARRASVETQMRQQRIPFRWWDAVDGSKPMPEDEVRWYISGNRLKTYLRAQPGSQAWRKVACDLSHLRLMHDMIASGRDVQVVLEDDMQLLGDFQQRLNATLDDLPADWDVLWLNHGAPIQRKPSNLRGWVGPGLRTFTDNSATVGMVYRRSFALVMLNDAQIGNKDIDNVMNDVGQLGRAKAYVTDPPLIRVHEAGFPSTIEVDTGSTRQQKKVQGGGNAGFAMLGKAATAQQTREARKARSFLEDVDGAVSEDQHQQLSATEVDD